MRLVLTLASMWVGCGDPVPSPDAGPGDAGDAPDAPDPFASCPALVVDVPHPFPLDDSDGAQCALDAAFRDLPTAAVVCSGEDSHGVAESAAVHGIVFEYLMRAHGARTVLIESGDAATVPLDDYIATGDESRLAAYFEPFARTAAGTNEAAALIRHLRELSLTLGDGDRVHIRGIDVAVQPTSTFDRLAAYFAVTDPMVEASMRAACPRTLGPGTTASGLSNGAAYLDGVIEGWDGVREGYIASTDAGSTDLAYADLLDLRDGYRFLVYYAMGDFSTGDAMHREPGLERNLLRAAEGGETVMVMAHNAHCAHGTRIGSAPSLGTRVSSVLTSRYVVIGQSYGHGVQREADRAGVFGEVPVGTSGTWAASLAAASELPQFIMLPSQPGYAGDAEYYGEYGDRLIPTRDFDAIVFLSEATASTTYMR